MPNKIKPRRSYTANSVPLTTDLETHELAIRWADNPAMFTKDAAGQIVSVPLGGGGGSGNIVEAATAAGFPATGASGTLYIATDVSRAYRWSGSVYVEVGSSGGGAGDGTDAVLRAFFVPAAPTSVTATVGNAQATLSWTAPTVLSQTPITDYTVQFSSNSGSTWTTFTRAASTATSAIVVTGLTNGTAYVFRVAATNGAGAGAYSTQSNSVTPGAGDPNFANVSLLMHFEGSSLVDSGPLALSITPESTDVQLSSAQARFGSKSVFWATYVYTASVYTPNSTAFGFGTGDFTIEFWLRYQSLSGTLISIGSVGTYAQIDNGGALYVKGVWANQIPGGVPVGEWIHVAISRSAGTTNVYTGGTRQAQLSDSTDFGSSAVFRLGPDNGSGPPSAYIDEVRVTKGVARYTGATLTVPAAAFPDS